MLYWLCGGQSMIEEAVKSVLGLQPTVILGAKALVHLLKHLHISGFIGHKLLTRHWARRIEPDRSGSTHPGKLQH